MVYNKAWEVQYARDRAHGRRRYVDANPTRAKLQRFVDANVPYRAISRACGLSDTAVGNIVDGRNTHVQRATAERIDALTLNAIYDQAHGTVPSIGAQRRVQALMALGWPKQELEAAGIPSAQLVTRPRSRISVEGWQQVRDVYDELSMTRGPSELTRSRAIARGYPPPLAWDDDTLDDPQATPHQSTGTGIEIDNVAVARAVASHPKAAPIPLTPPEQLATVRELTTRGTSVADTAAIVGTSDRTVLRWRKKHDLADADATFAGDSARDASRLRQAARRAANSARPIARPSADRAT
ncbi:hypothetical protein LL946_10525 [Knoellia locipacati]|uniref:hypothetical protein n=1 Tax=Knoellia locipacati TaxID=882824 RepID=UPI0038508AA5